MSLGLLAMNGLINHILFFFFFFNFVYFLFSLAWNKQVITYNNYVSSFNIKPYPDENNNTYLNVLHNTFI